MKISILSNHIFSVNQMSFDGENLQLFISSERDSNDAKDEQYCCSVDLCIANPTPQPIVTIVGYLKRHLSHVSLKPNTIETYRQVERYLTLYGDTDLNKVTTDYLQGFVSYLESSTLSKGTVYLYFSKLKCVLHDAYKNDLFDERILLRVKAPRRERKNKVFLTEAELRRMAKVDIPESKQNIRDMFLFSSFTGLRFSDVLGLKRKDIVKKGDQMTINFHQRKTSTYESLPLSEQARQIILTQASSGTYVFGRESEPNVNTFLKQLCRQAKIKKNISFHTARHTFCVMLLSHDVPIFTVQKLMCHSDIRSTNVYADILNKTKSKAVKKLPVIDDIAMRKVG